MRYEAYRNDGIETTCRHRCLGDTDDNGKRRLVVARVLSRLGFRDIDDVNFSASRTVWPLLCGHTATLCGGFNIQHEEHAVSHPISVP